MSVINRIKDWATSKFLSASQEQRIQREVQNALYNMTIGGNSAVPINDNPESYVKEGFNKNDIVYSAITYTAEKASVLPVKLVRKNSKGEEEQIMDSPAIDLWHRPNQLMSGSLFRQTSMCYMLATGNAYTWGIRLSGGLNKGKVASVEALPSQYMEIISGSNTVISGYQLNDSVQQQYDVSEIAHARIVNLEWGNKQNLYGQSPLKAGGLTVQGDNENTAARQKQSKNGGALGIVTPKADMGFTETDLRSVERALDKKLNGKNNRGRVAMSSRPLEYHQFGLSSRDMDLIEGSMLSMRRICNLFGLSSILFNDMESSTYDNYRTAERSAMINSVLKYFQMWLDVYNDKFVRPYEDGAYFIVDKSQIEVLQPDLKETTEGLQNAYWVSNYTKQKMTGVEIDESIPEYMFPSNLITLDDLEGLDDDEAQKKYGDYNR